jgi:O-antigen/teichoic acid export membrane protein
MVLKRILARNIIFNWSSQGCEIALGFLIAPFLINRMGDTNYGLWTVIGALTGYFGVLDFGTRTSVGRFIAFHRAKGDFERVNATFNTAGILLVGVGILALLGMLLIQLLFFDLFRVPEGEINNSRLSLLLVSLSLALNFPLALFDATLWGFQRFDLMNSINIVETVLRALLTFCLIKGESDLITLAWITLGTTVVSGLLKAYLSFSQESRLYPHPRYVRLREVRNIFGYGIWHGMTAWGTICSARVNPIVIGSCLGVAMVTPFSLANRLVNYTNQLFIGIRSVLTPAATTLHAQETKDWQKNLMIQGGKYNSLLALFIISLFLCLGPAFLSLWIGPRLAYASNYLNILVLGLFLPLTQSATFSMLFGIARHKILGWMSLLEMVATPLLAIILIWPWGLTGACLAQALTGTLCRGVVPMIYSCRLIHLPLRSYLTQAVFLPILLTMVPFLGLFAVALLRPPETWPTLFLYCCAFALCFGILSLTAAGSEGIKWFSPKSIKSLLRV